MYLVINYPGKEGLKVHVLFIVIIVVTFLCIGLIACAAFHFPLRILPILFLAGLITYYCHFDLLSHDKLDLYGDMAPGYLRWIVLINNQIIRWFPSIARQEWHKHRALLVIGPPVTLLAVIISLLVGVHFHWTLVLVAAISVALGFYSITLFPLLWGVIASFWDICRAWFRKICRVLFREE